MSQSSAHRVLGAGPVITTAPGAVPPIIVSGYPLVMQPLQFPLQPALYPSVYSFPTTYYPQHMWPRTEESRFFPVPIPPLFPPVYGPIPPLIAPLPPPIYPYPAPPFAFPIVF
ncbi:hypothetical protein CIG75_07215 [Tumebacillus algifaecis]|uniref:Uncharacterized protein n=1 Tax=Tumebacillus algifaecis TaxID=1214604 RepID=A0A223CZT6_9BACL|nr:hypothetical protein [Tumebacillus algifaecis]ASS74785.1 hypothetical protein CIG75_07215 [Tumebacillus algifaecis]